MDHDSKKMDLMMIMRPPLPNIENYRKTNSMRLTQTVVVGGPNVPQKYVLILLNCCVIRTDSSQLRPLLFNTVITRSMNLEIL